MARDPVKHAEAKRRWQREHRAYYRQLAREQYDRMLERCREDSDYYAEVRADWRVRGALRRLKQGGKKRAYRPRYASRIPQYALYGGAVIDGSSQWLKTNSSQSQEAYARDLMRERQEFRR